MAALKGIQSNSLVKPLVKTIRNHTQGGESLGLYSGLKGFTDLMLPLGQRIEDISQGSDIRLLIECGAVTKIRSVLAFE